MKLRCKYCDNEMELKKHISLVDCPGHSLLMSTMLNGTCVMDTTILVESAVNKDPAPQTREHLLATSVVKLSNSITCLNKTDLIKKELAAERLNNLKNKLQSTPAEKSPIIPLSANYGINIDILCEYICNFIEEPKRELTGTVKLIIIRSFNINKQETDISLLDGGVVGGTITKGVLHVNDKIIIYPGITMKNTKIDENSKEWSYTPLIGNVLSIHSETNNLDYAISGGLLGIKIDIDPGYASKDGLVGNILTHLDNDEEYKIYERIFNEFELLENDNRNKISHKDIIIINSNACNTKSIIIKVKKNKMELKLIERPICIKKNDYITLSKIVGNNNVIIIGRAIIIDGAESLRK